MSTIARFDPTENSWTKLGNLNVARIGHAVIQVDTKFIVVGGRPDTYPVGEIQTESCKLNGDSMTCTMRKPQLLLFSHYPVLMLMP